MPKTTSPHAFRKTAIEHLDSAVRLSERILDTLMADERNLTHILASLLFSGVVEGGRSTICLLNSDFYYSIPKLLRPVMEMAVNLTNIGIDESYAEYVLYDSIENENLSVWNIINYEFKNDDERIDKANCKLENNTVVLRNLLGNKYIKLKQFKRFEMASMLKAYHTMYSLYSTNIHGNIHSLEEHFGGGARHSGLEIDVDRKEFWIATHLEMLALCLGKSAESVTKIFSYTAKNRIAKLHKKIDECRTLADNKLKKYPII